MIPMCYPADHYDKNFIPNWSLWFIIQVEDYARSDGDPALIVQLKPRIEKLLQYFSKFENKWDCNSPITNVYSPYLKDRQSHLYIEHVRGLYRILERINRKYPDLPMMLCSGGGGRSDYEALKYFTEFWPSDNTDAVERIYIQWGFSHFFPSKTLSAHVTSWGKQPVKFRTDVAMTGKLGFDIRTNKLNEAEQAYCRQAVQQFKRLSPLIGEGDLYRLQSPLESDHAALLYSNENRTHAVLFAFDIHPRYAENIQPLRLKGLDPDKIYRLEEICLTKVGVNIFSSSHTVSHIVEIREVER